MDKSGGALRFIATGQALMQHALREDEVPGFRSLVETMRGAEVAFTNYEGSLRVGEGEAPPGRHPSPPHTLHDLRRMGFNLLSLANNHAAEAGPAGIPHTKAYAENLGCATAGTGGTLEEAMAPAYLETGGTRVALIAIDGLSHKSKEVLAGEEGQPGVNGLHGAWVDGAWRLDERDVARNLRAVEEAAARADYVFVSLHEHFWLVEWREIAFLDSWPPEWTEALPWKRALGRQLIDAGATAVLCHGMPRVCAIEVYRGRPIFHSLGNFIFHLPNPAWWPHTEVWEGVVAEARLAEGAVRSLRLIPFVLADAEGREDVPSTTRLYPTRVTGERAAAILRHVTADSAALGTDVQVVGDASLVRLG